MYFCRRIAELLLCISVWLSVLNWNIQDCAGVNSDLQLPTNLEASFRAVFACPAHDGIFADPLMCEFFYVCIYDRAARLQCPSGLAFDDQTKICIQRASVKSCQTQITAGDFRCPAVDGPTANPYDCDSFYLCWRGSFFPFTCFPPGYKFDMDKKYCVSAPEARCSTPVPGLPATVPAFPITGRR